MENKIIYDSSIDQGLIKSMKVAVIGFAAKDTLTLLIYMNLVLTLLLALEKIQNRLKELKIWVSR